MPTDTISWLNLFYELRNIYFCRSLLFQPRKTLKCKRLSCRILVQICIEITTDMTASVQGNDNPGNNCPQKEYLYAL